MPRPKPATTLSIRIPPEMRDELTKLADATGRTKSFLAAEALASYLLVQSWQVNAIKKAVKNADSKEANFVNHENVVTWVNSWDSKNEQDPPS